MEIVERIGAYAGVLAFLAVALLAMLYFSIGRDLRRLREWAGRAPERSGVAKPFSEESVEAARPKRARFRLPAQPR